MYPFFLLRCVMSARSDSFFENDYYPFSGNRLPFQTLAANWENNSNTGPLSDYKGDERGRRRRWEEVPELMWHFFFFPGGRLAGHVKNQAANLSPTAVSPLELTRVSSRRCNNCGLENPGKPFQCHICHPGMWFCFSSSTMASIEAAPSAKC